MKVHLQSRSPRVEKAFRLGYVADLINNGNCLTCEFKDEQVNIIKDANVVLTLSLQTFQAMNVGISFYIPGY